MQFNFERKWEKELEPIDDQLKPVTRVTCQSWASGVLNPTTAPNNLSQGASRVGGVGPQGFLEVRPQGLLGGSSSLGEVLEIFRGAGAGGAREVPGGAGGPGASTGRPGGTPGAS